MVKKTSILGRIKDRWKSPAGVKVSTGDSTRSKSASTGRPARPQAANPANPASARQGAAKPQAAHASTKPVSNPTSVAKEAAARGSSGSTAPGAQAAGPHATANRIAQGAGSYGGGAATEGPAPVIDRLPPAHLDARPLADRSSKRKVSDNEEAVLALKEGFQELASLLRGMQSRGDAQGEQLASAVDQLKQLPGFAGQQLEALGQIATGLERQGAAQEELTRSMSGLPEVMRGVEKALVDASTRDARTAQTLGEFRGTMTRMQDAMGEMVQESKRQADSTARIAERDTEGMQEQSREHHKELLGAVEGLSSSQQDAVSAQKHAVAGLRDSQREVIEDLRRAQQDQARKLEAAVDNAGRWNQALLVVLLLLLGGLGAVLTVILSK